MSLIRNYRKLFMQIAIHRYSLVLGSTFRWCYWALGSDSDLTDYFLNKYRDTRRKLPGGYDPATKHSTRLGAYQAFLSTQDD